MSFAIPRPLVLMTNGSSLSANSRLATPPRPWPDRLAWDFRCQPEAVGPFVLIPRGHGGWMSGDIRADLLGPGGAAEKPTHVFLESGDINASVVSGGVPAEIRTLKTSNQLDMIAALRAANPAVDITFLTMSPVSTAGAGLRPNLADYYTDTVNTAIANGCDYLDLYAAWPHPLPEWMTNGFDGLHPVMANAFDIYAYRAILYRLRQKAAAFYGLAAPAAPAYPADGDVDFLLVAGGGAPGGGGIGGGGGAGGVLRGRDYLAALLGAFSIGAAGVFNNANPGQNGGDTVVGAYRAKGGGGGGLYSPDFTLSRGRDGGSSGGGGTYAALHQAGNPIAGQGFSGGPCNAASNGASGAGGGCTAPGTGGGVADSGVGGPGWTSDVPGDPQDVAGGGPGNAHGGVQAGYPLGGGPTKFGGGGSPALGDNGGIGKGWIWYPGAPRCAGGVITSSGGYTVHALTGSGTLV
ncbi:MAG: SGNH/GDSL hydrolase family protein [Pseudomonadota bacterium]